MPIQAPDEVLRRLCLAYPWSAECQGVGPIKPTDSENAALWHGSSGYEYATGRSIPKGSQCESVQLIPLDKIHARYPPPPAEASAPDPNRVYLQVPVPAYRSLDAQTLIFPLLRPRVINDFI
jgi:hypothetical protein